ncbi:MAG: peptide deformylase [Eubacterium sp.]|nr:peptide deformylase [Eubacterium sp.]
MGIRIIREDGDEVLRKKCKPVKEMTERLSQLIDDMFDTMYEANGVGLAAPQVGVLRRIVVIDVMDGNPLALVNPEIVESDGEQIGPEGCLSLPGLQGEVARPAHVIVKALDRNMNPITVEGEELLARALCHEIDHLDGVLYKDLAIDGLYKVEPVNPDDDEYYDDEDYDEDQED